MTIVFNNALICNGSCGYCTAKTDIDNFKSGTNLEAINKRLYEMIQFDFDALEEAIIKQPDFNEDKVGFSIWGGDPLASWDSYIELYYFLEYIGLKYNKHIYLGGSTNGLAFQNKDVVDFMLSHPNIRMQLSHDGLGQFIRTRDVDPLKLDCMEDLWKNNNLKSINCVLNQLNFDVKENCRYFDQYKFLHNVRIYSARDERYAIPVKCNGFINGKYFEELKDYSEVNLCIHNSNDHKVFEHACDDFFEGYYWLGNLIREGKARKYASPYIDRIRTCLRNKDRKPLCAKYHLGLSETSSCIDTLGKYTECHLLDSNMHVPNKEMKKPEKCNGCKFIDSHECNTCGRVDLSDWPCQHNYRLNQWAIHFKDLTNKTEERK